jgi:hypothetical protein
MKLVKRLLILFLTALFFLKTSGAFSGSGRLPSIPAFQPGIDQPFLAPSELASPVDQEKATLSSFPVEPPGELFKTAGGPSVGSQTLSNVQSSTLASSGAPIDAASIALLKEIQDLATQRQVDLVSQTPGWLHLILRQFHTKADSLTALSTSTEPIQLEQWLSLDDQGRVQAKFHRLLNDQSQGGDSIFLSGGSWTNLPMAGFSATSSTLPFDPSYGLAELVAQLVSQGQTINKGLLYKECWYQGDKYTLSDGHTIYEIVVKPDSHALRWIKTWQVNRGVINLVDSLEIALEERLPQPPDDIIALASQASP